MESCFFTLRKIPDLTLAQYSVEESAGVEDVIRQHSVFYRQLNRKALLFGESYQLIYTYNPFKPQGKRLDVYFRVSRENAPVYMEEFMASSPLSAYFKFEKEDNLMNAKFTYRASVKKQDNFIQSSLSDVKSEYYSVNAWKPNEKARLMGLFKMMKELNKPLMYVVSVQAVDYAQRMRDSFQDTILYIRNIQKMNMGNRDENGENCLRNYEKFLESLNNTPHFKCQISTYAQDEAVAKMILDAATSEAVEEGNYELLCEKGEFNPFSDSIEIHVQASSQVPYGMREWNTIFLLKELVPFVMFPVLYPAESIEIPKESAPIYERTGLYLGKDNNGYQVYFPLDLLSKHALLAGVPGSGKTYSMLHLCSQIAGEEHRIPILVLEPAKKEYRALAHNLKIPDLMVFSPGAAGAFPLRINPFEFPKGLKLSEHITNLNQVFQGAFDMTPPAPFLVSEAIDQVYREHGWYSFEVNDGTRTYPSMRELYDKIAQLLDASDYSSEVKGNIKSFLQVRIGSLLSREMGNVFDVPASTFSPEEWMENSCVIELETLGSDAANFLTLLLLTLIRETIRQNPKVSKEKPRHVIFLEEAHNLIGPTTVANSENGDTKVASTKYIVDMLAEVRALREAIVIADQLPTALAPQVTKNTSLKIAHRITAMDDRELLASTMSADGVQLERMGSFQPGHALCVYENIQKPFEIQISEYEGNPDSPDNEELFDILSQRECYQRTMERDFEIMKRKFISKKAVFIQKVDEIYEIEDFIEQKSTFLDEQAEDENLKLLLSAKKMQLERNIHRLVTDWLEFVLHINDYGRINRLQFLTINELARGEFQELFDFIMQINERYPDKYLLEIEKIYAKITSETTWIAK